MHLANFFNSKDKANKIVKYEFCQNFQIQQKFKIFKFDFTFELLMLRIAIWQNIGQLGELGEKTKANKLQNDKFCEKFKILKNLKIKIFQIFFHTLTDNI